MPTSYLGIDLHKRSSTWVLLDHDRTVLMKKTVPVTPAGLEAALRTLPHDPRAIRATIEPVCSWRWFSNVLMDAGMDVRITNPVKARLIAESRMKNDTMDATLLAELLKSGFLPEAYRASDDVMELRSLVRQRGFLAHTRVNALCRLHGLIGQRGMELVPHNPGGLAGRKEVLTSGDQEFVEMLAFIDDIDRHMAPLTRRVGQLARSLPIPKLLMTMPGIGTITALTIYAEVGDFSRFPVPKTLAAYAGIVPRQRSSGDRVRGGRITRLGPVFLRTALIEAAFRIRSRAMDERLFAFYERLAPTTGKRRARVALAHKMLCIMWYMVKHNEPYRPLSSESTLKRADLVDSQAH